MRSIISNTEYIKQSDKFLKGRNYLSVIGDDSPTKNAKELNRVYELAKTIKPNNANLSATNRLKLLVAPGKYTFGIKKFEIDTDFIDVCSLTGEMDIIIDGLVVNADNVIIKGFDCGTNVFNIENAGENVIIEKCKGLDYVSDRDVNQSLDELYELVNILLPENAMVTSSGSYVVSKDGKYLITI